LRKKKKKIVLENSALPETNLACDDEMMRAIQTCSEWSRSGFPGGHSMTCCTLQGTQSRSETRFKSGSEPSVNSAHGLASGIALRASVRRSRLCAPYFGGVHRKHAAWSRLPKSRYVTPLGMLDY
jgi:hypothetical protein